LKHHEKLLRKRLRMLALTFIFMYILKKINSITLKISHSETNFVAYHANEIIFSYTSAWNWCVKANKHYFDERTMMSRRTERTRTWTHFINMCVCQRISHFPVALPRYGRASDAFSSPGVFPPTHRLVTRIDRARLGCVRKLYPSALGYHSIFIVY